LIFQPIGSFRWKPLTSSSDNTQVLEFSFLGKGSKLSCFLEWVAGVEAEEIVRGGLSNRKPYVKLFFGCSRNPFFLF